MLALLLHGRQGQVCWPMLQAHTAAASGIGETLAMSDASCITRPDVTTTSRQGSSLRHVGVKPACAEGADLCAEVRVLWPQLYDVSGMKITGATQL